MMYKKFLDISYKIEEFMVASLLGGLAVVLGLTFIFIAGLLGLMWIFSDKTDKGQCLQYRTETYYTYMHVNNSMMPIANNRNVCEVWEYPSG